VVVHWPPNVRIASFQPSTAQQVSLPSRLIALVRQLLQPICVPTSLSWKLCALFLHPFHRAFSAAGPVRYMLWPTRLPLLCASLPVAMRQIFLFTFLTTRTVIPLFPRARAGPRVRAGPWQSRK
jgi:hypothetical protein